MMKQVSFLIAAALLTAALPCAAVPDAAGQITSTPAPDLAADGAMKARLNYNLGYETYEKAMAQEVAAAKLKGAAARETAQTVAEGFSQARERFRTVVGADPNMKEAWNLLGYTSRRLGDYEESLSAYSAALKLEPEYPEAIEYRAELFLLTGRLTEAREAYATLQKMNPSYAGVLLQSMRNWVAAPPASAIADPADKATFAQWVETQKL
jgi:tetratricopeptide (TPR) repeat protein